MTRKKKKLEEAYPSSYTNNVSYRVDNKNRDCVFPSPANLFGNHKIQALFFFSSPLSFSFLKVAPFFERRVQVGGGVDHIGTLLSTPTPRFLTSMC